MPSAVFFGALAICRQAASPAGRMPRISSIRSTPCLQPSPIPSSSSLVPIVVSVYPSSKRSSPAVRDPASVDGLIAEHGDRIVALTLDLTDPASITAAAVAATDVDIVINNAGVLQPVDLLSPSAFETLDFEFGVNLRGLIHMAQAFAPVLKANGGGAFVQLNSVASLRAFAGFATYCASKAAAYSITQSLRELLAEQGTQVVSVHPGPIATDMADSAGFTDVAAPSSLVADAIIAALAEDRFHAFPDPMAEQVGGAYSSFAEQVVEAQMAVE